MASDDRKEWLVTALGYGLLVAYVVQAQLALTWSWLVQLQGDDRYKVVSGCALAGYLVVQWTLSGRRRVDPVGAVARHKLYGALAPLILYAHATRFSYGYLLLLAVTYLSNTLVGLLGRAVISARSRGLFTVWFIVHIAIAVMLVVLAAYHVVIALAYE